MCGIAGFTWESEEQILGMCRALAHRGPDDEGIRVADGISLGHRRLAVLDLSSAGHNPLPSDDERYWVVHNGEIYNYLELREELRHAGRSFRSDTDTEVIANAFAEWGPQCVERFHGMFAFAVFDTRRKELFLARDRIGIKPLYFAAAGDRFAFASELKALLECPHVSRELDPQSLLTFMGFEFVASPRSIFRDIRSLPPAHMIRVSSKGECEIWRYWDLSWSPKFEGDRSEGEAALLDCLRDSVKERLRSDVPVGVFLSGGIDSSALVALMAEQVSGAIPAFTLAYEDESFSELQYAESVAKRFHLEHHVLKIQPITPDVMVEAIWHLDQPMADLSALPFFLISEVARKRVTVALSGEGGDEIFAGYDRFRAAQLERLLRPFGLDWARRQFGPWIQSLEDRPEKKGPINMLRRFVEGLELPSGAGAMRWQHFLTGTQAETLFRPEVLERMDLDRFATVIERRDESGATDPIDLDLAADLSFTMPDSLLMKVDKMSMARGLEVRVPFLDHRLVELAARFPSDWKLHRMETKSILRSACASLLPDHIVRRGKQGYSLPVKNWLRGEMQPFAREVFDRSQLIARYFQKEAIETLWQEHSARRANHNHLLWSLLNASLWHERFVEQREVPL